MQVVGRRISSRAREFIGKRNGQHRLDPSELHLAEESAVMFISRRVYEPAVVRLNYQLSAESRDMKDCIAYLKSGTPSIFLHIDNIYRNVASSGTTLLRYIGSILVHELSHLTDYERGLPITLEDYDKINSAKGKADERLITQRSYCWILMEVRATELELEFLHGGNTRRSQLNRALNEYYKDANRSPKYVRRVLKQFMDTVRVFFGSEWYEHVSNNVPTFEDFNNPEEYVSEALSGGQ